MDFNIDYAASSRPRGNAQETLYASVPGRAAALGEGEVVFYDAEMDRNHVMTEQVLRALDLCRGFEPMEVHVGKLAKSMAGLQGQHEAIRRVLQNLATRGLLVTADAFLSRMTRPRSEALAPAGEIFIRTADRAPQLHALLQSLAAQHAVRPLPSSVVVIDDSQDATSGAENKRLAAAFSHAQGIACRVVDRSAWTEAAAVLGALVERPADLAGLLVRPAATGRDRVGSGIGRNLISLLARGTRHFLLDDDFLFPLRWHADARPGVAFRAPAWEPRTYPTIDDALAAGGAAVRDPFAEHLALCGHSLGNLLRAHAGLRLDTDDLRGWQPSTRNELGRDARVMFTMNGHRGNSFSAGISWLYLLGKRALTPMLADPEAFQRLRGDPPVWWGVDRFQISRLAVFTPFAIDGSQPMPPTSPFGRGQDAVFDALAMLMHADGVQVDLPCAVGHRQADPRDRSALLREPERADVNHSLAELARQVGGEIQADDPWRRLLGYAARLEELVDASDARLAGFLREYQTYTRSQIIARMQAALKAWPNAPDAWRNDVLGLIEASGRAVIERAPPRFDGWPTQATEAECLLAFRHEAGVLARGIRQWPAAWQHAEALRTALGLHALR